MNREESFELAEKLRKEGYKLVEQCSSNVDNINGVIIWEDK